MSKRITSSAGGRLSLALTAVFVAAAAPGQTLPVPPVSPVPVAKYEYDAEGNPTKVIVAPSTKALVTQQAYDSWPSHSSDGCQERHHPVRL